MSDVGLVGEAHSVEPSLVGDIPAAVSHVVNGKTVALSPVTIQLTDIVEARRIVVRRLELLRLEQSIRVRKVELAELLLACRAADASNLWDGASVTCVDGRTTGATRASTYKPSHGLVGDEVATGSGYAAVDHDGLLLDEGRLRLGDIDGLLGRHGTNDWLLLFT